jgi:hypothetical protein
MSEELFDILAPAVCFATTLAVAWRIVHGVSTLALPL